jgi:hypothetical protein
MINQPIPPKVPKKKKKRVFLPNLGSTTESDRTLLQTKFLSTHNSYITEKQLGGTLSRNLVLDQLEDLYNFPICIELDVVNNGSRLMLNHCTNTTKTPDSNNNIFTGILKDELRFLYHHIRLHIQRKTYPLVISIDTTNIKTSSNFYDAKCSVISNKKKKSGGVDYLDLLDTIIHDCLFNSLDFEDDGTPKKFFNYKEYCNKCILKTFGELIKNEDAKTYFTIVKNRIENDCLKDISKYETSKFIEDLLGIKEEKYPGIFKYLEDLIGSYKQGCISVNVPLKELMNTILIRYKPKQPSFEYSDSKILPLGSVHLNGNLNTKSYSKKTATFNDREFTHEKIIRFFPHFKQSISEKSTQYNINSENDIKYDTYGLVACDQISGYKTLNKNLMELNYDKNCENINMIAFNWHDICKTELDKLTKAFTKAYEPFLYQLSQQPQESVKPKIQVPPKTGIPVAPAVPPKNSISFQPAPPEVNVGSRKKRNLKRKNSKKSKRRRRKSRKL